MMKIDQSIFQLCKRKARYVTQKHFFSVAHRFGAIRTEIYPQWSTDHCNKVPIGALKSAKIYDMCQRGTDMKPWTRYRIDWAYP